MTRIKSADSILFYNCWSVGERAALIHILLLKTTKKGRQLINIYIHPLPQIFLQYFTVTLQRPQEMPDTKPGPLPQKSRIFSMSHHISIIGIINLFFISKWQIILPKQQSNVQYSIIQLLDIHFYYIGSQSIQQVLA